MSIDAMGCTCSASTCRRCRAVRLAASRRLYVWTPALHEALRSAYASRGPIRRSQIDALVTTSGFSRQAIHREVARLGLVTFCRRPWTDVDDGVLRYYAGELATRTIATRLRRTAVSVRIRAMQLGLCIRIRAGYSMIDVAEITGADRPTIAKWIDRGYLGQPERVGRGVRVSDEGLVSFIRLHAAEIDLLQANQLFLEGVMRG